MQTGKTETPDSTSAPSTYDARGSGDRVGVGDFLSILLEQNGSLVDEGSYRLDDEAQPDASRPAVPSERSPSIAPGGWESAGLNGLVVGVVTGLDEVGDPLVGLLTHPEAQPISGRALTAVRMTDVGREVLLAFPECNPQAPIVLGFLHARRSSRSEPDKGRSKAKRRPVRLELDGRRLVITAGAELVLRCGDASITLTRAGKILIRGKYLLSRSAGVNRIKGGSVQIN